MATQIVKMVLKLDDKASPALGKVGGEAGEADKKFGSMKINAKALGLGLAAAGLAALGAAKAFVAMGQSFADQINLFNDMSTSTGLSVDTLENLNLMAKATGVNLKGMERGLVSFQRNLGEAREGTGTLTKALETLKLDPEQFENADDALQTVLASIATYGDSADRAKLLNEAFGLSAKDMAKVMKTGFGDSAQALELMGLRIGESTEDAKEAQRGLALYDLVLDKIKRSAFETFLGGGGFAEGLSVVVGIATGLSSLLGSLSDILVGVLSAVGNGIKSLALLIAGDMEGANQAALDARDSMAQYGGALVEIATLKPFEDGVKSALDFQEALEVLGREAEEEASLLAELHRLQGEMGEEGPAAVGKVTDAMKAQADAAKALQSAWEGTIAATQVFRRQEFDVELGFGDLDASLATLSRIAGDVDRMIDPVGQVEQILQGMPVAIDRFGGLLPGVTEDLEGMQREWLAIQQMNINEGFGAAVDEIHEMQIALAESLITIDQFRQQGEQLPNGVVEMVRALEEGIMGKTWELEMAIKASEIEADALKVGKVEADRLIAAEQIAGTIGAITGAVSSAASGDIAGAAQGIGAALGASPIFGAIVGGLGAIAEIGKMSIKEVRQNTRDFVDSLANGIEVIVEAFPTIIRILLTKLPGILLGAVAALAEFVLSGALVKAIAQGFIAGIKNSVDTIKSIFTDTIESKEDIRTEGAGFWVDLIKWARGQPDQSFAKGTAKVQKTGRAIVHRGETIIPAGGRASQNRQSAMSPGGVTINISTAILDRDVIPRLVREIDRAVGTYGRTSAAFAGS